MAGADEAVAEVLARLLASCEIDEERIQGGDALSACTSAPDYLEF
jgi:hypothetical protein